MADKRKLVGYACLTVSMIGVGSTVVVSKIIGDSLPAFTAAALRLAIASPIFVLLLWRSRQSIPRLGRRDWGLLVIQAAAGSVAYTVLLILTLRFTSAANAGVVVGTLPVIMGLLAILAFGERPRPRFLGALAVAGLGVLLVTLKVESGRLAPPTLDDAIGIGIVLAAIACEAVFLLLNRKLSTPVPALPLSALMSLFGFCLAVGPAGVEVGLGLADEATRAAVIGVVYYALVPTVIGFFLWYEGAGRTTPGEASLFTAVLPVSTLLLAALILHEPVSLSQAAGCALVVAAIVIGIGRSKG